MFYGFNIIFCGEVTFSKDMFTELHKNADKTVSLTCPRSHLCPYLYQTFPPAPPALTEASAPPEDTHSSLNECVRVIIKSKHALLFKTNLIELIPDWVEILLHHSAFKHDLTNADVCVGITFALLQTTHNVIFSNQTLSLQQDESQESLYEWHIDLYSIKACCVVCLKCNNAIY